jgi:Zn-dependent protease with chaperone function
MSKLIGLRKDLVKIVTAALFALFLLPLITFLFTLHVLPNGALNVPSDSFSPLWQFQIAQLVSMLCLVSGILILIFICCLGVIAFINRKTQYISFVIGWRTLILFCAAEVIIQGVMLVWLAFWLTAVFFNIYVLKLIILAALFAGVAVFSAVVYIFKRVPENTELEGELLDKSSNPGLWEHVSSLATKLETTPPDHIVAGIDTNFFVTEAMLTVKGGNLTGRSLFVSLPLLRILNRDEADAVLAHELAHFRGGDTTSSAALGPKLTQYDYYSAMQASGAAIVAYYILRLYRVIFEFALKRDSRAREFLADRTAASIVSGKAIVNALIKIGAYSRYRNITEQKLFAELIQHDSKIGIANHVAEGLAPYAMSAQFLDSMQAADIPHPFDSHPALNERMQNVNHIVSEREYSSIVVNPAETTWISDIQKADSIEQALWTNYESQFSAAHEQQLAYRYQPSNEIERAVVLKYFPPIEFLLSKGKKIVVSYEGLALPDQDKTLSWDYVENLQYEDAIGSDILRVTHPNWDFLNGTKTTKIKINGAARKQRDQLKVVLGHYWQRNQIMRKSLAGE